MGRTWAPSSKENSQWTESFKSSPLLKESTPWNLSFLNYKIKDLVMTFNITFQTGVSLGSTKYCITEVTTFFISSWRLQ